jgi:hypothetical protein
VRTLKARHLLFAFVKSAFSGVGGSLPTQDSSFLTFLAATGAVLAGAAEAAEVLATGVRAMAVAAELKVAADAAEATVAAEVVVVDAEG